MGNPIEELEKHRDLLESPILAQVAFRLPDGLLANNVVSFLWDGERVGFSTLKSYFKYRCLLADDLLTMLLIDPKDPRRYLEIRGHAELSDDADHRFINRIAMKYFSLEEYPYHQPGDERVTVMLNTRRCRAAQVQHGES